MATYVPPKRATAYIIYVGLESQAAAGTFKAAATLAAGDFQVSKDGGALANLTDLPTVTPTGGRLVKITLTATEMTADNVTVVCSDAAGAEWYDLIINIATAANQIDDIQAAVNTIDDFLDTEVAAIKTKTDYLPSATAGAAGGVFIAGANAATTVNLTGNLSGSVGSVTGAVGSVTGNVGGNVVGSVGSVSGDTKQTADVATLITTVGTPAGVSVSADVAAVKAQAAAIEADTQDLQARTPAALVGGRMDANAGAISGDAAAADNLETMLDGTGGATLSLKKLYINNPDGTPAKAVEIVSGYTGIEISSERDAVRLLSDSGRALYMATNIGAATVYFEGPTVGTGSAIAISSPGGIPAGNASSGQAIWIETEEGHPAVRIDFQVQGGDVLDVVDSDNGDWVWDDKLFSAATDAAGAVRTELAVELAHLDADVSTAGGGVGMTPQETADAVHNLAPVGVPAVGSVGGKLNSLLTYGVGTGTGTYTDTVTDGISPIDNVLVQLSTDSAGTNIAYQTYTGADGVFTLHPDPGTYYVWLELAGYSFTQGAEVVVT